MEGANSPCLGEAGGKGAKWGLERPEVRPAGSSAMSSGTTALHFRLQLHTLVERNQRMRSAIHAQCLLAVPAIVILSPLLLRRGDSHVAMGENANHSSLSE